MVNSVLFVYLAHDEVSGDSPLCVHNRIKRTPSLGLLYLCEVLRAKKVTAGIKDQTVECFTLDQLVDFFEKSSYGCIGFYSYTAIKNTLIKAIRKLKSKQLAPILVGGPGSLAADEYLEAGADIVCQGEGEETIVEIIEYFQGKRPLETIKGICFLRNGKQVSNPARSFIENLDKLTFPKRDYYPIKSYFDYHFFGMRLPYATLTASRGCPHNCSFCNSPGFWGRKFRLRSPGNVLSEIDFLHQRYGIRYIGFKDDMFGAREEWLREFCHGLIRRNYRIKWSCMLHPFSLRTNTQELLGFMKKAGLDVMAAGLQSTDPRILRNINRSPDEPAELAKTIAAAKRFDVTTVVEFIVGLPGDDAGSMRANLQYAFQTRPHFAAFYPLCVLDGSEIDTRFPDRKISSFSASQIETQVARMYSRYFFSPRIIWQNTAHIFRKNPRWFFTALRLGVPIVQEMFLQRTSKRWKNTGYN